MWTASGAIADVNALLAGVTLHAGGELQRQLHDRHQRQRRGGAGDHRQQGVHRHRGQRCADGDQLVAAETYTEDTPLNLVDIVVSDVDSANVTATLTLSNPAAGQLEHGDVGCGDLDLQCGNRGVDRLGGDRGRQHAAGGRDASRRRRTSTGASASRRASATGWRRRSPAARRSPGSRSTMRRRRPTCRRPRPTRRTRRSNLVDIVVSDVDSANVTATLTLSNPAAGSLSTATSGAVTSTYNARTGVWTASGAIADVNTLLAGRDASRRRRTSTAASRSRPASATGWRRRSPAARRSPASRSTMRRRRPTCRRRRPTPRTCRSTWSTSSVSDVDSSNVTATLTLSSPAAGSLSTATSGAVTSTYNAATGVWTASGAIADVNALLAGRDAYAGVRTSTAASRSRPASATGWRRRSPAARRSPGSQ